MTSTKTYTAAVVQSSTVPFDPLRSTQRAVERILEAGAAGAKLIVFPEAFISGYPKGSIFEVAVGVRTDKGRELFRRYFEDSIEVPGPETEMLAAAASRAKAHVVIGVMERAGGTMYCTALFFGPDGTLLGKHRKLLPTAAERLVWGSGDGSTLPVIQSPLGKIGAVICWENYMPALRLAMFSKGITIYCAPTADDRDTWAPSMQHIALEGRCFVLSACQYMTRSSFPEDYELPAGDQVLMRGGSLIVNPLGKIIAGPDFNGEIILYAEIDQDEIVRGKMDLDASGHYSRPDVFRLLVNEAQQRSVVVEAHSDGIGAEQRGSNF